MEITVTPEERAAESLTDAHLKQASIPFEQRAW